MNLSRNDQALVEPNISPTYDTTRLRIIRGRILRMVVVVAKFVGKDFIGAWRRATNATASKHSHHSPFVF